MATNGKNGKKLGKRGVEAAARYLERSGYEILDLNWKCEAGEIGLVARDFDGFGAIVFVKVKTCTNFKKGFPADLCDAEKIAWFEKIAMYYLAEHDEVNMPVRFDLLTLMVVAEDRAFIRHNVNVLGLVD